MGNTPEEVASCFLPSCRLQVGIMKEAIQHAGQSAAAGAVIRVRNDPLRPTCSIPPGQH